MSKNRSPTRAEGRETRLEVRQSRDFHEHRNNSRQSLASPTFFSLTFFFIIIEMTKFQIVRVTKISGQSNRSGYATHTTSSAATFFFFFFLLIIISVSNCFLARTTRPRVDYEQYQEFNAMARTKHAQKKTSRPVRSLSRRAGRRQLKTSAAKKQQQQRKAHRLNIVSDALV